MTETFTKKFFESLVEQAIAMNAKVGEFFGSDKRIFTGTPAVEITLTDSTRYRLTFVSAGWIEEDRLGAVAYREGEDTPRFLFIP